ncbi:hypothetical protein [Synechococcus sp. PCC 7336]|uniref:hypothetical protein n=1 Tax=Synechococcus sp. PCC 7336 TaxID=195250 RepID=UPI00034C6040|nr:hypothetical protein [Synechococcus sp. PCC 7336]
MSIHLAACQTPASGQCDRGGLQPHSLAWDCICSEYRFSVTEKSRDGISGEQCLRDRCLEPIAPNLTISVSTD